MISPFQGKRRIFSFPKAWANAVVRWIAGIHSPNGTMEISNTLNPGDDGSLGLDVNLDAVVDKVKVRLGFDKRSPLDRNDVRNIVFDLLDGASVINSGRRVAVSTDWINANIAQTASGGGSPENPTQKHTANITTEGTSSNNTTSHSYDGSNGLQLTVCSRVMYDHTASTPVLYGFYRVWTFDKNGRLYSVSGESRYEIDTPVVGNLTT